MVIVINVFTIIGVLTVVAARWVCHNLQSMLNMAAHW